MHNETPPITNTIDLFTAATDLVLVHCGLPPVAAIANQGGKVANDLITHLKRKSLNKKLEKFIEETRGASDEQRIGFLKALADDAQSFQEKILLLLERLDEEKKATIIGKLCHALILRSIEPDAFHRLTLIIEKTYFADLTFLHSAYKSTVSNSHRSRMDDLVEFNFNAEHAPMVSNLVSSGLLEPQRTGILHGGTDSIIGHNPTALGKMILTYGF